MKYILFVPARKGSTGLKGKNLINLNGKPLIDYTLKLSQKFPKEFILFVSTDSKKIKDYSKKYGFKENYLRPKKLSTSKSNIVDGIIDGIEWLKKNKDYEIEDVILLQEKRHVLVATQAALFLDNDRIESGRFRFVKQHTHWQFFLRIDQQGQFAHRQQLQSIPLDTKSHLIREDLPYQSLPCK